jgi:prophage antirepressor-like protein
MENNMYHVKLFFYEGRDFRTIVIDGNPWWMLVDVCRIIGIRSPTKALRGLDSDEFSTLTINGNDSDIFKQNRHIVNESGLYTLIMKSNKPDAKEFRKWVTLEVIPSIRKTGSYSIANKNPSHLIDDEIKQDRVCFLSRDTYDDKALWEFICDHPNNDDIHYHEKSLTYDDWNWISERSEKLRSEAIEKLKNNFLNELLEFRSDARGKLKTKLIEEIEKL